MPTHVHAESATSIAATAPNPNNTRLLAQSTGANMYAPAGNIAAMSANAVTNVGGSQAHLNMQPFLTLNFSIALQGIFPSQN
jgi:microcystin-dependent protein